MTGTDGGFTLVPASRDGTFSVCPHPPTPNLLSPCSWATEIRVLLTNGQTVQAPPFRLQPAVDLYVRVNDPNGTLASSLGKVPGAALLVTVRSPNGRIIPIPMTARDSAGFDHHLPVPAGTDLGFAAFGSGFSMTDALGQAISQQTGLSNTVNIPVGQTPGRKKSSTSSEPGQMKQRRNSGSSKEIEVAS